MSKPSLKEELQVNNPRTPLINKIATPWRRQSMPIPIANGRHNQHPKTLRPQAMSGPAKEVREPLLTNTGVPKNSTQRRVKRYRPRGCVKAGPSTSSHHSATTFHRAETFGQQAHVDSCSILPPADSTSRQPSTRADGKQPAQHISGDAMQPTRKALSFVNSNIASQYPSSALEQIYSTWKHLPLRMDEAYAQWPTQLYCAYCFTLRVASLLAEKGQWCDTKMIELAQWKTFVKAYRRSQRPIKSATFSDIEYGSCKSSGSDTTAIALHGCTMHKGELEDKGPPPLVPSRPRTPPIVSSNVPDDVGTVSEEAAHATLLAARLSALQASANAAGQLTIVRPYIYHQRIHTSRQDSLGQALQTITPDMAVAVKDLDGTKALNSAYEDKPQTERHPWLDIAKQAQALVRMEIEEKLREWTCPCANCHEEVMIPGSPPPPTTMSTSLRSASCPATLGSEIRDAQNVQMKSWLGHYESDDDQA